MKHKIKYWLKLNNLTTKKQNYDSINSEKYKK